VTHQEFNTWMGYHMARFTGIAGWLAKFPPRPRFEGDPTQVDVRDAWFDVLRNVDWKDAQHATDDMHRGEEELPKSFDDHPRYVSRIAGKKRESRAQSVNRRRYIDGEETVACLECNDAGNLQSWHKLSIKAARKGDLFHPTLNPNARGMPYKTCVRCTCEAANKPCNRLFEVYDPSKHFLVYSIHADENWQRLMDDVASVQASAETFNPDAWN
jgi:hypothetical protein